MNKSNVKKKLYKVSVYNPYTAKKRNYSYKVSDSSFQSLIKKLKETFKKNQALTITVFDVEQDYKFKIYE